MNSPSRDGQCHNEEVQTAVDTQGKNVSTSLEGQMVAQERLPEEVTGTERAFGENTAEGSLAFNPN